MTLTLDRTRTSRPLGRAGEDAIAALSEGRAANGASRRTRTQHPVIGAVALDLMASIAGPAWSRDNAGAWSAAFEIVTRAMADSAPARSTFPGSGV